jgi:hypothetical protein
MLRRLLSKTHDTVPAYQRKPLFLDEEKRFYARLRRALPKCYIYPNVDLCTLMVPVSALPRENRAAVEYLAGRQVDFAVFDAKLSLLCVIELDDADGAPSNEEVLKSVGIKRYSWDRRRLPSADQILRALSGFSGLPPPKLEAITGSLEVRASQFAVQNYPCLTPAALDGLAPGGHLRSVYPHVWKRLCSLRCEPQKLDDYLNSLSVQDRPIKRTGFSIDAMEEVAMIQRANQHFIVLTAEPASWDSAFAHR